MNGQFQNVAGRALGTVAALTMLRNPGALMQMLAQRQEALNDPRFRENLGPFTAGVYGVGGSEGYANDPRELARAGLPAGTRDVSVGPEGAQRQFIPNLPPLTGKAAVEQQKIDLLGRLLSGAPVSPADQQMRRFLLPEVKPDINEQLQAVGGVEGLKLGSRARMKLGGTAMEPSIGFAELPEHEFNLSDPADAERAAAYEQSIRASNGVPRRLDTTRGTTIITAGSRDANAVTPETQALVERMMGGGGGAPAAPSRGLPLPTRRPEQAPPAAPQGLSDDLLVDDLPVIDESVGYPSPAFGADAPPAAAPQAGAPAGGLDIPPGGSVSVKAGGATFTRRGLPLAGAASGEVQRSLSLLTTGAQAAAAAKEQLARGPQTPLTLMGMESPYQPGALTGPVSGRVLSTGIGLPFTSARVPGLSSLSGQPLAQEASDLGSLFASARLGVVAILGSQMTGRELEIVDALMPSPILPTEINQRRLDRLQSFFQAAAGMQAALANLRPDQQKAIVLPLFTGLMGAGGQGAPAPAPPAVLDLR